MQSAVETTDGGSDVATFFADVADLDQPETYQVMPSLGEDEYGGLKADIREHGVRQPVVLAEDPQWAIIDGHHRVRACRELGIEEVPARIRPDTSACNRDLAWRLNMQRRHLSTGDKRECIERYILDLAERETHKTDAAIAGVLAVSQSWVSEVRKGLVESGKITAGDDFTTQKSIREKIREAIENEPDKSDRQVADDVGTSHPTVGSVRSDETDHDNATSAHTNRRKRPKVFRHRPYLDSRAQEYLNQAARRIAQREPEWVGDPTEPTVAECLRELRERNPGAPDHDRLSDAPPDDVDDLEAHSSTDTQLITDLLAAGLDYQEVVYWVLYEYDGLDPIEVFHATAGKQKSYSHDLDRHAIRNTEHVLASAAEKLDAEVDLSRSAYMYTPAESEG